MKSKLIKLSQSLNGIFSAEVVIPKNQIDDIKKLIDCDISLEIKKYRNKRSLDANAYAWVLITQIAEKLNETSKEQITKDDIYVDMLKHYGVSLVVSVKSEEDIEKIEKAFKYYEPFGSGVVGEKQFTHYKIYIGSSNYDTKEMSVFIKGIISECEELGIPTLTPAEIAELEGIKDESL